MWLPCLNGFSSPRPGPGLEPCRTPPSTDSLPGGLSTPGLSHAFDLPVSSSATATATRELHPPLVSWSGWHFLPGSRLHLAQLLSWSFCPRASVNLCPLPTLCPLARPQPVVCRRPGQQHLLHPLPREGPPGQLRTCLLGRGEGAGSRWLRPRAPSDLNSDTGGLRRSQRGVPCN